MATSAVLIVLLMMGAGSTRNMQSNLAEKNKYDCFKLHHVGYLTKYNNYLFFRDTFNMLRPVQAILMEVIYQGIHF
jgi:hypothetical protein